MKRTTARVLAGLGAAAALVVAAPLAASAHVTIDPNEVSAGSYPTVNVRVPTESDTASTIEIEMTLPTDHPFLYVGYQAVPGWTVTVASAPLPQPVEVEGTTVTEAPSSITFTADPGAGIRPGQFQEFPIVLGPVPDDSPEIVLPATQTYDDGTVAQWTNTPEQVAADDSLEPAPVLNVGAAGADDGMVMPATGDATDASATGSGASSGLALGFGIGGFAVGVFGAVVAVVALLRTRRTS